MFKSNLKKILFFLGLSIIQSGHANDYSFNSALTPRLSITGLAGTNNLGFADAFLPLFIHGDNVLFADGQGNISDNIAGFAGGGLGYRQIINNNVIAGSYLFYDHSATAADNTFSVLNPGLEAILINWDWHANAYFPIGIHHYTSVTGLGENLGLPQFVSFNGHNQFDHLVSFEDVVGNGLDSSVGYTIQPLNRLRLAAGIYYYHPTNLSSIRGIASNLSYPVNNLFNIAIVDSYDNVQHNTIGVGLTLQFGGISSSQQNEDLDIHNRLTEPVQRNLSMQDQGGSIPDETGFVVRSGPLLTRSNIWFFTTNGGNNFIPAGGIANCTITNPCSAINLTTSTLNAINTIAPNANIYTNPGDYSVGNLSINKGQSLYGRTSGYQLPAYYNGNLPNLIGSLTLNGDNTIQAIQLFNDSTQIDGVKATNADNIVFDHDIIGATNANQGYQTGIDLNNTQNIILQNSTVIGFANNPVTAGVAIINKGDLTITNSNLLGVSNATDSLAEAISNEDFGNINISNSTLSASSPTDATVIFNEDFGKINIANTTITSNSTNLAEGLFNEDFGQVKIANTNIFANGNIFAAGIFNQDFGLINIANSTIIARSSNQALGVFNQDFGQVNIVNSIIIP